MKVLKRFKSLVFAFLCTAMCLCAGLSFVTLSKDAQVAEAILDTSVAVKAGGGAELWDSANNKFNEVVLDDLADKLFECDHPATYIKSGNMEHGSYIIPAPTINERVGERENGLVVKLGGLEWIVSSLTLADIASGNDSVIATLYLSNVSGSCYYNNAAPFNGNRGATVYSSSVLRSTLLSSATYKLFSTGSFATTYLVQPKNITYQQTETMVGRVSDGDYNKNFVNDALGTLSSGWDSRIAAFNPSDTFSGVRYDAWGNDYIWVPSITEVFNSSKSIWKLSSTQKRNAGYNGYSWLRSGLSWYYGSSCLVSAGDGVPFDSVSKWCYGLRPAIHLNLTAAGLKARIPTQLETTYNGTQQDLVSLKAAGIANWLDTSKMTIGASTTNITDVGEHIVPITLTDDEYIFRGQSATTRTYDFKIKINPQEVNVNTLNINSYGLVRPGKSIELVETIASADEGTDREPKLALEYRAASSRNWVTTPPTVAGDYYARAYITNPSTCNYVLADACETAFTRGKDPTETPWFTYVGATTPNPSTMTSTGNLTTVKYTGAEQQFTLTNDSTGAGALTNVIVGKRSGNGFSYKSSTGIFTATEVGTYTVSVSLGDGGANHQWDDTLGSSTTRTVTLKIEEAELDVKIVNASDFTSSFEIGSVSDAIIEISGIKNGEAVELDVYYKKQGESTRIDSCKASDFVRTGDTITATLSLANLVDPDANYTLCVELTTGSTAPATNANYVVHPVNSQITFFVVTSTITSFTPYWQYTNDVTGVQDFTKNAAGAYSAEVDFNENAYTVGFDPTRFPKGLEIVDMKIEYEDIVDGKTKETTEMLNADVYTITVTIKAKKGYELAAGIQTTYVATLELKPVFFDVDKIVYTQNLVYSGRPQTVKPLNLPTGISYTSSLAGGFSDKETNAGTYKAKFTFTISAVDGRYNYSFSDDSDVYTKTIEHEWEIEKQIITLSTDPSLWLDHFFPFQDEGYIIPMPAILENYPNQLSVKYYSDEACTTEINIYDPHTQEEFDKKAEEEGQGCNGIKVDLGTPYTYYSKVTIDPAYAANYQLLNPLTRAEEVVYEFVVGDKRDVINLKLDRGASIFMYDGTPQGYLVKGTTSIFTPDDFDTTYFKDDGTGTFPDEVLDDAGQPVAPTEVGMYKAVFTFKDAANDDDFIIRNKVVYFEIKPLVVYVQKWNPATATDAPTAVLVDEEGNVVSSSFVDRKIYTDPIDTADPSLSLVDFPTVSLVPDDIYWAEVVSNDPNVTFADGANTLIKFAAVDPNGPKDVVSDPELVTDKLKWTGSELTFEIKDWDKLSQYLDITAGSLTQTEVGVYTITLEIKFGKHAEWETSITDDVGNEVLTRELTFEITKRQIEGKWSNKQGYADFVLIDTTDADFVEKTYYELDAEGNIALDGDGNPISVSTKDMKEGKKYRAVIKLKPEYAENGEFVIDGQIQVDDEGNVVSEMTSDFEYHKPQSFFAKAWKFIKDNWLWFVIGLACLLLLILLWIIIVIAKRRKKKKEEELANKPQEEPKEEENPEETKEEKVEEQKTEAQKADENDVVIEDVKEPPQNQNYNQNFNPYPPFNPQNMYAGMMGQQPQQQNMQAQQQPQWQQPQTPPSPAQQVIVETADAGKLRLLLDQLFADRERRLRQDYNMGMNAMQQNNTSDQMMREFQMKEEMLRDEYRKEANRLEELIEEQRQDALREERRREERRQEELREQRRREERREEELREERRREERRQEMLRDERRREERREEERREDERRAERLREERLSDERRAQNRREEDRLEERLEDELSRVSVKKSEEVKHQPEVEPQPIPSPIPTPQPAPEPEKPMPVEPEQPTFDEEEDEDEVSSSANVPDGAVLINGSKRLDLDAAFQALPAKQKQYFNKLRDYATKKPNVKVKQSKNHLIVAEGNNPYLKLVIKRNMVVACFKLESAGLKDLKRGGGVAIKTKDTEIKMVDDKAFDMAKQMIDLRGEQIAGEKEYIKQMRREKRRQDSSRK